MQYKNSYFTLDIDESQVYMNFYPAVSDGEKLKIAEVSGYLDRAGIKDYDLKEINDLRDSVERLDLSWEGEANRSFMVAIESDITEMFVLSSLIWDARTLLEQAEGRYQEAERGVYHAIEGTN